MTIAARAQQLTKTYGSGTAQVVALDNVDFEVYEGEFTAIMGPSGSGKSTLMHLLAALDSPTLGKVFIGDTDVAELKDTPLTKLRRDRIGFIFQSFNLVPTLNARENILLPLAIAGKKADEEWFDRIIDVLGLKDRLTHKPAELSGGQQQRVACARALMNRPEIIFGDEPTGNLDSTSAAEVLGFLRRSVDEFGQTIVMVTHDAGAASYADRAVFLSDGKIVEEMRDATQDDLLQAMSRIYPRQDVEDETDAAAEDADGVVVEGTPSPDDMSNVSEPAESADQDQPTDQEHAELEEADAPAPIDAADAAGEDGEPMADMDDEPSEYGEPMDVPALYRDGGTEPSHAAYDVEEEEVEISRPRRAIQD